MPHPEGERVEAGADHRIARGGRFRLVEEPVEAREEIVVDEGGETVVAVDAAVEFFHRFPGRTEGPLEEIPYDRVAPGGFSHVPHRPRGEVIPESVRPPVVARFGGEETGSGRVKGGDRLREVAEPAAPGRAGRSRSQVLTL